MQYGTGISEMNVTRFFDLLNNTVFLYIFSSGIVIFYSITSTDHFFISFFCFFTMVLLILGVLDPRPHSTDPEVT